MSHKQLREKFLKKFWWKNIDINTIDINANKFSASECSEITNFWLAEIDSLMEEKALECEKTIKILEKLCYLDCGKKKIIITALKNTIDEIKS